MENVTKPMQIIAFRWTAEEKERLEAIARERRVTVSWMIREGLRLYMGDAKAAAERAALPPAQERDDASPA